MYSIPLHPGQPLTSGMKRAFSRNKGLFDGITTMDQLIRMAIEKFNDRKCLGSREVFSEEEEKQPDGRVFKKYTLGEYRWLRYREVNEKIDLIAAGLLQTGIKPRQNLAIFAETRLEWMLTAQALLRNNIRLVTLYATLGKSGLIHGINETEVTHIVTSQDLLGKIIPILPYISSVTHIIYMENQTSKSPLPAINGINLIPFSKLEEIGLAARKKLQGEVPGPNDTAIIMYTSGSSGVPKGVMISQSNLVAAVNGYTTIFPETTKKDSYIAYLPLAHVMELACESLMMSMGSRIGYSSPLTLIDKGTGIKTGQRGDAILLQPTIMLAVPVILDRVRKGIIEAAEAVLGGQIRVLATGSAPLCGDTFVFLKACFDLYLMRGYGLTETTSGVTVTEYTDNMSDGSTGCPIEGQVVKLIDWKEGGYTIRDKPNPRGELVVGGIAVTKGDIGELLPNGTIRIVDRKKDLVKLQFGEYIALGKASCYEVEAELKTSPLIDNIYVHGNPHSTFLVALISPNMKALQQLAVHVGVNPNRFTLAQLCKNPDIAQAAFEQLTQHARLCNLNKMEIPVKMKLCAEEWLPESGLVTASLKIRRKEIQAFYQNDIDRMYNTSKQA
ncbi:long-chain-fatty-acid--CoA ligase 4-like [Tropilaelaps mercedesae]|uniref:long-chain-fatty-acid--CoA ligase n=1 Tax=Tropilaelaps mercedesae TaxID=418985 RepID=A0A1V9Y298_9ACAR|nr:long-chain-fatty-acid--CoA ligase 4-like [Tropilaelaps mercedesae]